LLVACADQLTFGSARARVQNNLVRAGYARFIEIDGIPVCRITSAGRKTASAAVASEMERQLAIFLAMGHA